jgi:hypothetical protein
VASGIAIVAGAVLALALLALALPVHVAFRVEGVDGFSARVNLRCLFGLLRFGVELPAAAQARRQPRRARLPAARQAAARRSGAGRAKQVLAVLRQAPLRRRVLRLGRSLLAATHLRQVRLRLRLGLGDPADTGRLWALMGPVSAWAQGLRQAQVQIEPEFMDAVLEFQVQGQARLVPLQLLLLTGAFALSPEAWRAWRTYRDQGHHG